MYFGTAQAKQKAAAKRSDGAHYEVVNSASEYWRLVWPFFRCHWDLFDIKDVCE